YHEPIKREPSELIVPFEVLNDIGGSKNDPVTLHVPRKAVLSASWEERGIRRALQYRLPKAEKQTFPQLPESLAVTAPRLVTALRDAFQITDHTNPRYALGCIHVRGSRGQVAGTDGSQL